MIRKELEMAFAEAVKEAQKRQHDMLTVEHILYAFLNDNTGREILSGCGADIDSLKTQLENFFVEKMQCFPGDGNQELIVCVNKSPGIAGFWRDARSVIVSYGLR